MVTVTVPTLWTIMNSSYHYEYQENIHLGIELTPASVSRVWLRARIWLSAGWLTHHFLRPQGAIPPGFYPLMGMSLLSGTWSAPNKGNADRAKGIFGNAGRVWAATGPTLKTALCHTYPVAGRMTDTWVNSSQKLWQSEWRSTLFYLSCIYTFVQYTCFT